MQITRLLPAVFMAALLCGCPDTKLPKAPPSVPQPKAASAALPMTAQATHTEFFS